MNASEIISSTYLDWEEHIEMYPGDEWAILANVIAIKLEKQQEETEYYRRLANVRNTSR